MKIRSLADGYRALLRDRYFTENQIARYLPKLVKAATEPALKKALKTHLLDTKIQAERLEHLFGLMDMPVKGEKYPGIDGLIAEAQEFITQTDSPALQDLAIVTSSEKIKHYEIGSYKAMIDVAKKLGLPKHVAILKEILKEEQTAAKSLRHLTLHMA